MTPLGPQETRVQARSREGRWCWTLTKSWTTICGSRRDQKEGGELDSHEELDYHLRVQARSREGRWCWTLTKSWTTICGSRRDPEEGGELDFHGELDYHL